MLVESSLRDLMQSINQIDTTARQHVAPQVQIVGGFQSTQSGSDLILQCKTSTGHLPKIRLSNVSFDDTPTSIEIMLTTGESIPLSPIPDTSPVLVTCDCEDFVYRFATTDQQHGVLFGKITHPSIPKTNRRTQNLGKIGICKHLVKFVQLLRNERVIK